MQTLLSSCLLALTLLAAPAAALAQELKTEEQRTLYALGLLISRNLSPFTLSAAELETVKAGLSDGVLGKTPKLNLDSYGPKIQELHGARQAASATVEKKEGQAFVEKAAGEQGASRTASGLIVTTLKPGTGAAPKPTDKVKIHYHGTLRDGTVFDSSVQRGQPATFPLNGVIKCFSEGVSLMKVGGKSKIVCPSNLAYGDRGAPPKIKPGATLVFEVELLEIVK